MVELFHTKHYQIFTIPESKTLHKHPIFRYFTSVLHEWNSKVQHGSIPLFSETNYQRNLFIYDTLRKTAVQNLENADRMLKNLEEWYNGTQKKEFNFYPNKMEQINSKNEEW